MAVGRPRACASVATFVGFVLAGALVVPGSPADAAAAALPRPDGAGPPVKASGMGTQAALDNPRCRYGDPRYGPYGRFDATSVGGGPPCVKAWKSGADNGGATAPGVTRDRIKVVFVIPNEEQQRTDPVKPTDRRSNTTGTHPDAIHDYLVPQLRFHETWGRDLEVHFFTSTGSDEQAQRADIVAITALKPFAVANAISGQNLEVLEAGLAAAKIVTWGYTATYEDSAKQSPYRWGSADNNATAVNSAEVLGKQLLGKKAEFGGDDVVGRVREIGVVSDGSIDEELFAEHLRRFGGSVTAQGKLPAGVGDEMRAAVPTVVTRLKNAGVTTIVLFTGAQAVTALMEAASGQDYFPEWFFTGASYQDIGLLARGYPPEQSRHAFGITFIAPATKPDPEVEATTDSVSWYWGRGVGTYTARYAQPVNFWLLSGIHAAGPKLTPKTFKQGLFALPPRQGAAAGRPDSAMIGFAKTPKLPWDQYAVMGYDFAPYWWDPDTEGPSNGLYVVGKGVGWYVDGGKRYVAGTWPKKQFAWFDKSRSIHSFDSRPGGPLEAVDCRGCPSTGGPGQPGAPSDTVVVFRAGGTGASAA